jgi:hypothetical protein
MQLDTLEMRGEHGVLSVGFATGGPDDEHVQLDVSPAGGGKLTQARIVRVTREGKEKVETRPPP